jgi:hypothetical protein
MICASGLTSSMRPTTCSAERDRGFHVAAEVEVHRAREDVEADVLLALQALADARANQIRVELSGVTHRPLW